MRCTKVPGVVVDYSARAINVQYKTASHLYDWGLMAGECMFKRRPAFLKVFYTHREMWDKILSANDTGLIKALHQIYLQTDMTAKSDLLYYPTGYQRKE